MSEEEDFMAFSQTFRRLPVWAVLAALGLASADTRAEWVLPPGGAASLGGGVVSLGCASLRGGGALDLGGGALLGARDVVLDAGAQLAIGAGRVELAQQWADGGASITLDTGRVERKASPGCPVAGQPGQVLPAAPPPLPPALQPVPALGAGGAAALSVLAALLGGRRLRRRAVF
jgi:hypothetical protein